MDHVIPRIWAKRWSVPMVKLPSLCKRIATASLLPFLITTAWAQNVPPPKYSADVPSKITTPDAVETRIGTLKFNNGVPDQKTIQLVYDQIDFVRGIEAFLAGMPATSVYALCEGFDQAGFKRNQGIGITEDLMDARSLFLTPNTTTVYVFLCLDPKDGPMVMQVPPGVLGPVDDADFRWVTDVGLTGPDAGKGGKYLFVPPGYTGTLPSDGYFVAKPRTNTLLVFYRAFVKAGDIAATVRNVKANAAIYPLHATTETGEPPATTFVNTSGVRFNTISANTFGFYEELNGVVQNEPANFVDPDTVGLFAAIGIKKGKPFAPDARMKAILTDAVAVANGFARGQEPNWVQTMPGKGWNVLLRLYGPLEPWFDKSWKPGDIELVQ